MSHKAGAILWKSEPVCFPSAFPVATIPLPVGSDSYLLEVGGPAVSLLGLSFICELFVCSALHCDTARANLPNEPQELHNNGKTTTQQRLLLLTSYCIFILTNSTATILCKTFGVCMASNGKLARHNNLEEPQ